MEQGSLSCVSVRTAIVTARLFRCGQVGNVGWHFLGWCSAPTLVCSRGTGPIRSKMWFSRYRPATTKPSHGFWHTDLVSLVPNSMSGGALTRRQPWLLKVWAGGRKTEVILFYSSAHTPRRGCERRVVVWTLVWRMK